MTTPPANAAGPHVIVTASALADARRSPRAMMRLLAFAQAQGAHVTLVAPDVREYVATAGGYWPSGRGGLPAPWVWFAALSADSLWRGEPGVEYTWLEQLLDTLPDDAPVLVVSGLPLSDTEAQVLSQWSADTGRPAMAVDSQTDGGLLSAILWAFEQADRTEGER